MNKNLNLARHISNIFLLIKKLKICWRIVLKNNFIYVLNINNFLIQKTCFTKF